LTIIEFAAIMFAAIKLAGELYACLELAAGMHVHEMCLPDEMLYT